MSLNLQTLIGLSSYWMSVAKPLTYPKCLILKIFQPFLKSESPNLNSLILIKWEDPIGSLRLGGFDLNI